MISRVVRRWRWLRRRLSRTHWAARMLGVRTPPGEAREPGLILIQLDGLSRTQFERALANNNLPFLAGLMRREHFDLETFYSGVPSTTPAVQGELFFGVRAAVPGFQFFRRGSGREFRMYQAASAVTIEDELLERCPEPLLAGAHAYSNIYRAGAERSRYCSRDFAPDEILKRLHPFKWLVLTAIYLPKILRMIGLAVIELGLALVDAVRGLYEREDLAKELTFVPSRVAVCILLREAIRFRMLIDVERGVRLIHANFLGYDEQAHRRGPDSAFAHWTLRGIDRAVRDVYRAMARSDFRDYEMMIYSDHGQEHAQPYARRFGRELEAALADVFANGPLAGRGIWIRKGPDLLGAPLDRCRAFIGLAPRHRHPEAEPDMQEDIVVAAMGPLGHIYLPRVPDDAELSEYAAALVEKAGIPLVMLPPRDGMVRAFTRRGRFELPRDRMEILGEGHPFSEEAAADLIATCGHPDAGDIIISGWEPGRMPLSFPNENGAHAGPGNEETRGFLLVPDRIRRWHVAHLPGTRTRVRAEDLRAIALHYLGRDGEREERVKHAPSIDGRTSLRVMTYNIHSCAGTDGKIRPERVARAINHCDPDVVAIQEIDCHRPRTGGHDQSRLIADHLRMHHFFQAMFEEEKERYGIAIFSKYPLEVVKAGNLTEAEPKRMREARGAIWVKLALPGIPPFHFINTHFGLGGEERRRQAETMLGSDWLGGISRDEPLILCGDFNSGPQSTVVRMLRERMRDAQLLAPDWKPRPTFSSIKPLLRIDHVFVSEHFEVEAVQVPVTSTSALASDHLPLCVELVISPNHERA